MSWEKGHKRKEEGRRRERGGGEGGGERKGKGGGGGGGEKKKKKGRGGGGKNTRTCVFFCFNFFRWCFSVFFFFFFFYIYALKTSNTTLKMGCLVCSDVQPKKVNFLRVFFFCFLFMFTSGQSTFEKSSTYSERTGGLWETLTDLSEEAHGYVVHLVGARTLKAVQKVRKRRL